MTKKEETAAERIERLKKEKEANKNNEVVQQLTHKSTGEPDYNALAEKLNQRNKRKADAGANDDYIKMTLYVKKDIAAAFRALCSRHGLQKEYTNEAFKDFIKKKTKELGL